MTQGDLITHIRDHAPIGTQRAFGHPEIEELLEIGSVAVLQGGDPKFPNARVRRFLYVHASGEAGWDFGNDPKAAFFFYFGISAGLALDATQARDGIVPLGADGQRCRLCPGVARAA
jgi:hypothetical protein